MVANHVAVMMEEVVETVAPVAVVAAVHTENIVTVVMAVVMGAMVPVVEAIQLVAMLVTVEVAVVVKVLQLVNLGTLTLINTLMEAEAEAIKLQVALVAQLKLKKSVVVAKEVTGVEQVVPVKWV